MDDKEKFASSSWPLVSTVWNEMLILIQKCMAVLLFLIDQLSYIYPMNSTFIGGIVKKRKHPLYGNENYMTVYKTIKEFLKC